MMAAEDVAPELTEAAAAIGALAHDENTFRAAVDAFLAGDRDSLQRLLTEHKIADRCRLVCEWISSKICVLDCLELAGPPAGSDVPDLRSFAAAVVRITGDEELVERLADAITGRDPERFRRLLAELKAEPLAHLLCRWVCAVRSRLMCQVVCAPASGPLLPLAEELAAAGRAVATLLADNAAFAEVAQAVRAGGCEPVRAALATARLVDECHLVCEWLCSWRCVLVCWSLAQRFPLQQADLGEAYEFAQACRRLADRPELLARLTAAVAAGDADAFTAAITERQLPRFALQLCHWICGVQCRLLCRCVCPPMLQPWFTQIGHFDIYADIDPATGLTNKGLSFSGLYYSGGPGFAFTGCLELRGFCPAASPIDGTAMRYRFVLAGSNQPLTGSRACPVDAGTRRILWPADAGGVASTTQVLTFQSISIDGAAVPDIPPPAPGDAWFPPPTHVIAPDADGWIAVDPAHVAGGFTTLIGFNSPDVVPGGIPPAPPPAAGSPVPSGDQKAGTEVGIVFEATRVAGPASPPDSSNTLARIRINNWAEVNLLDILEFHTGGGTACSGITTNLHVEYTTDHEQMQDWDAVITSAALGAPITVAGGPDALHPRGDAASQAISTAGFAPCSYVVTLSTRPGLTTGLLDDTGRSQQKTFCVR
jgi:hypothetical protein